MNDRKTRNFKGLQLGIAPGVSLPPVSESAPSATAQIPEPDSEEVGIGLELMIRDEDLDVICQIGDGNGGTVAKVYHRPTGLVLARKRIFLDVNPQVRKSIAQELKLLSRCNSPYIVAYHGHCLYDHELMLCMEMMDCGSLDQIYKQIGALPEEIIACVNVAVVSGLNYLKQLNVVHRDVKPSNILVNSKGEIKLCDFGVSGILVNSIAETFVGTSTYMSPERISGEPYTSAGDVWSLGLTLVELALGHFPFQGDEQPGRPFAIFDLLQRIVNEPPPEPPAEVSQEFKNFVHGCLQFNPESRFPLRELCFHPFFVTATNLQPMFSLWAARLPRIGEN